MIFTLFTMCVFVAQSCPTLCNRTVCSPVHGILQARILEWIAIPFSRGTFQPRDQTLVACITGRVFTIWATEKSQVYTEPLLEFPEPYSKFPLAASFTYGNVSFHVTLSIHLVLSSLLPMSISLFSMSVSSLLPCKFFSTVFLDSVYMH